MISKDALRRIEDQAIDKFVAEGMSSKIGDDQLTGEIPLWTDADKYHMVDAKCTLPEDVIKDWLYGDFNNLVADYVKYLGVDEISDLADSQILNSPIDYFEYCMDVCQDAEDYFWDRRYPDLQQEYFEEHAERI